ncbi:acyltransferase [Sphingomonas sp. TREG-RG-20F-R18-01]|uniref:acyltransferase family protein n=1 Tax=Sphingomonas sp. TREG-RG-20F-R18-01 TaxID=2914982 RepID=UPI001F5918F3|nr:acyltransferase [Sphingomonas sp. TREG-RG-20F-R18-01]
MKRLPGIQYLRGAAACAVVLYHAADRAQVPLRIGEAGVDLFFVLSGFLMWAITDAASRPGPFLVDRAKRIVPSYWIVTSVMVAGALCGLFPAVRLTVGHVVSSYAFLPAISPSNGAVWPLLVPGWTLNYEAGFYALFALALMLPRGLQLGAMTVALLVLALAHPLVDREQVALYFYTDPHILEFLGGLWLAQIWQGRTFGRPAAGPALIALTVGLVALASVLPTEWPKALRYGAPALTCVAAMLVHERRGAGVPDVPWLRLLGDASYSIYLWHTLIISVTAKVAARLQLGAGLAITLHCVAGIAIGLLAYRCIERPIIGFFRRSGGRAAGLAPTVGRGASARPD